jgi:ABC-type multidrug transport system fused ATPase/permease subunit
LGGLSVAVNHGRFGILAGIGKKKVTVQKKFMKVFGEMLNTVERVRFEGWESKSLGQVHEVAEESKGWRVPRRLVRVKVMLVSEFTSMVSILIVVYVGLVFLDLEVAIFLSLLVIFSRLRGYVMSMQASFSTIREFRPAANRLLEILREMESLSEKQETEGRGSQAKLEELHLEQTFFSYNGDETLGDETLKDVSLKIRSGDRVLVRGPSGHGKTTLLKVLMGYFTATGGKALVRSDGKEESISFGKMRDLLFYCSDDMILFNSSIRANVDYMDEHTEEEILKALHQASLKELVERNLEGLDFIIGENGSNLSLGQRQRVLLSRLFLRRPKFVVLDEATSNIDPETEKKIFENILAHLDRKAIVLVAMHRNPDYLKFNIKISVFEGRVEVIDMSGAGVPASES